MSFKLKVLLLPGLLFSITLSSLVSANQIRVVSSIPPIDLIVKDIAGAGVLTEVLLDGAASPHHYTLKPSDMKRIAESDLFVWVGPELESFLTKAVGRRDGMTITLTHHSGLYVGLHKEHADGHDHSHDAGEDAHIWLSYQNAALIAKVIHRQLVELVPSNAELFTYRLDALLDGLKAEHFLAKKQLSVFREVNFGVYHDGYSAFVNEFELKQSAYLTIAPEQQISLKKLISVKRQLDNAACILAERSDMGRAKALAVKLGLPAVSIDLLASKVESANDGKNYARYMRSIRGSFVSCLDRASNQPK